jgi:hypothetical protein
MVAKILSKSACISAFRTPLPGFQPFSGCFSEARQSAATRAYEQSLLRSNGTFLLQISGARVKLYDAENGSAAVRMLEICGTMEQTQMAQGLLQTILQDASLNGGLERPR